MKTKLVKPMKSSNWILSLAALTALAGCNQDPFPDSSQGRIVERQIEPGVVVPPYSVEMPPAFECDEGRYCSIPVIGHVPEGGEAVLTFEGLPSNDIVYDPDRQELQWTPSFDTIDIAANPLEPQVTIQAYAVLRSTTLPETYRRAFNIVIRNVYRPITIKTTGDQRVQEGQNLAQTVEIESEDFPNGPFVFNLIDAPADVATVRGSRGNEFSIRYTPSRSTVSSSDTAEGTNRVKKFPVRYVASTPSGFSVEKTVEWTVVDDRAFPIVSHPVETTQGPEVNFSIRAEDPNNERAPEILVSSSVPYGRLTWTEESVTPAGPGQLPSRVYTVRWDEIPLRYMGQTGEIKFQVCGPSTPTVNLMCKNFTTKVNLVGNTHLAPLVERAEWPVAKIRYAKVGSEVSVPLAIVDAESRTSPVEVKIVPASMEDVVKWNNGTLTLKPTSVGLQSFSVVATSQFHKTTTEGFVFEAFPADRSDWAIVTDATFSKEVTSLQTLLGGGDVLSSIFQTDERSLALRKAIVVTTTALANAQAVPFVDRLASYKTDLLLVASPLVGKSAALTRELKDLGVKLGSRLTSVSNLTFSVDPASGLTALNRPAGLNGKLTAESGKPLTFDFVTRSKCGQLLTLQKTGSSAQYLVGAACERAGGGKIAAFGFEPGDMLLAPQDQGVVKTWLETLSQ